MKEKTYFEILEEMEQDKLKSLIHKWRLVLYARDLLNGYKMINN